MSFGVIAGELAPDEFRDLVKNLSAVQIQEYEALAKENNPKALVIVGLLRIDESNKARVAKDYEKYRNKQREGLALYRKAAEKDYAPAQYFLAEAYESVEFAGLDCDVVNKWLDRAVILEYAPAFWFKAYLYETNRCVKRDYEVALSLYKRANSLGYHSASFRVGKFYSEGLGVPTDEKEAHSWYTIAANRGFGMAQNEMGIRLSEGIGVKANNKQAVNWFKKSAEQGNVFGACNLALHYARGQGVAKNTLLALKWMYISHSIDGLKCFPNDFIEYLKPTKALDQRAWGLAVAWLRQHPELDHNFGERPWMK